MTEGPSNDSIPGRIFDVLTKAGKIGRLWTDDDRLLGFVAVSDEHQERLTSQIISAVHESRMDHALPRLAFNSIVAGIVSERETFYSGGYSAIAFESHGEPGSVGGPPVIQLLMEDDSSVGGLSLIENNWCYVRENGHWVEPFGADDNRFYNSGVIPTSMDAVKIYDAVMSTSQRISVDAFQQILLEL